MRRLQRKDIIMRNITTQYPDYASIYAFAVYKIDGFFKDLYLYILSTAAPEMSIATG